MSQVQIADAVLPIVHATITALATDTRTRLGKRLARRSGFSLTFFVGAMDLPTPREIDLEILLRERDAQVAELSVSSGYFRG